MIVFRSQLNNMKPSSKHVHMHKYIVTHIHKFNIYTAACVFSYTHLIKGMHIDKCVKLSLCITY